MQRDPKSFNSFFQLLCTEDYFSQNNKVFLSLKNHLTIHERLNTTLPPFDLKPKNLKQNSEKPKDNQIEDSIKPIPWRPNKKKSEPLFEIFKQKVPEDTENIDKKRKLYQDEDSKRAKFSKNDEKPGFSTAKELYTENKKNSPFKPGTGLKKPFICPIKGSEPPKEDSKISGIEEKLIEMIESEIITRNPCVKWSDIAGLDFAKKTVLEAIVWPLKRPDLFKGLRAPPKGLLLFGPPGTGKTMIGKAIASEVSATFFSISASSITSKWVGEGEKLVKVLFALAVKNQPSIIFIDEIDSLLSCRSDSEQEGSRRIKTEFLVQMDGAATNPDDRILLIGATNRPQELDDAMRRRLSKRMYIPLPNAEGRKVILENLMKSVPNDIKPEEYDKIVEKSKGYSGSDMKNLCTEASMFPLRSIFDIHNLHAEEIPPVQFSHFCSAFEATKSSVSDKDIKALLEWNQNFGSFQFDYSELDT